MTFGYCFSPNGVKLATSWNGLESSWLKGFFQISFWRKIKEKWSLIKQLIFFHGGCFLL
jgi:hypothetical protein